MLLPSGQVSRARVGLPASCSLEWADPTTRRLVHGLGESLASLSDRTLQVGGGRFFLSNAAALAGKDQAELLSTWLQRLAKGLGTGAKTRAQSSGAVLRPGETVRHTVMSLAVGGGSFNTGMANTINSKVSALITNGVHAGAGVFGAWLEAAFAADVGVGLTSALTTQIWRTAGGWASKGSATTGESHNKGVDAGQVPKGPIANNTPVSLALYDEIVRNGILHEMAAPGDGACERVSTYMGQYAVAATTLGVGAGTVAAMQHPEGRLMLKPFRLGDRPPLPLAALRQRRDVAKQEAALANGQPVALQFRG